MKQLLKYPFIIIMMILVIGISFLNILKKDTEFSELENRYLAKKPDLSLESYFNGSYSKKFEEYVNEQFILRNKWISLKAITETLLGKAENNEIIKGDNSYLFNKQMTVDKQFEKNIKLINEFISKQDVKVHLSIVPNSYQILEEYLPTGAPVINQISRIKDAYNKLEQHNNFNGINIHEYLQKHKDEYIYYRTDHHWTTTGAYYGYLAFCESVGLTPVDINTLESHTVKDFYGTYYSKYKGIGIVPDIITYYDIQIQKNIVEEEEKAGLYDIDKLNTKDKYAMFLYGNPSISIIHSNKMKENQGKKLLVVKDSYANSLIPFLTYHYDEIYVVDLRYYNKSINKLVEENNIEDIFLLYNFDTIVTDNHFYRLKQ
jgi:hypothetical protein